MSGSENPALKEAVEKVFPEANLKIGIGQWLLVGPSTMTTADISGKLGMLGSDTPNDGVVLSVGSYFGRAPLNIWEWLSAKMGDGNDTTGA